MKNKIMHVVGNRPQFVKLAPLSRELHRKGYDDIIIHTGQHYDTNMSEVFFQELEIDNPEVNLCVGSGSHAEITAKVMTELEKVLLQYNPELVILYGDTNSTVAAALTCSKLGIPIVHVEAGTRTYIKSNPEEINRIIVDHISDVLFCPDKPSLENLRKEGLTKNVFFAGDIMYDAFLQVRERGTEDILVKYHLQKKNYILLTWHRQENTETKERMQNIIEFLEKVTTKIFFPVHPRTKKKLMEYDLWERIATNENIVLTEPLGYVETVFLQTNSKMIVTDSGGLSKESYFAGVKCFFLWDGEMTGWKDLYDTGWISSIRIGDTACEDSAIQKLNQVNSFVEEFERKDYYGSGNAAQIMVNILEKQQFLSQKSEVRK